MKQTQEVEKVGGTLIIDGMSVDYDPDMQVMVIPKPLTPKQKRALTIRLTILGLAARDVMAKPLPAGSTKEDILENFRRAKNAVKQVRMRGLFVHQHKGRQQRQHVLREWPKH